MEVVLRVLVVVVVVLRVIMVVVMMVCRSGDPSRIVPNHQGDC